MEIKALYQPEDEIWIAIKDGDPRAYSLYRRHYSHSLYGRNRRETMMIAGPGEKTVLITPDCMSLFIWRKFIEHGQTEPRGINCAVFRREGGQWVASDMIIQAQERAWDRWPGERLYTYIAPWAIKSSNPGYCFKKAGWRQSRITPRGLLELETNP